MLDTFRCTVWVGGGEVFTLLCGADEVELDCDDIGRTNVSAAMPPTMLYEVGVGVAQPCADVGLWYRQESSCGAGFA
jgi:hypothetical protein